MKLTYELQLDDPRPQIGLVALQTDESIEDDFRRLFPLDVSFLVSRVPFAQEVSSDTLRQMEDHLTQAAKLMPLGHRFDAMGYGCTSGTAEIGARAIDDLVRKGCDTARVSEPVSALIAACRALDVRRLALLSPYVEAVSGKLRDVLSDAGIDTPVFGSFEEPEDRKVARISERSIAEGVTALASGADVDAVFISCTSLRTLNIIEPLENTLGLPVLSSNLVLGWHLLQLAGAKSRAGAPGRLFQL